MWIRYLNNHPMLCLSLWFNDNIKREKKKKKYENRLIFCACGCGCMRWEKDVNGIIRKLIKGHVTKEQREKARDRLINKPKQKRNNIIHIKGVSCDCGCNDLLKSGFAVNGVRIWKCNDCGKRFREYRTYKRGYKHTLETRMKMMRVLPEKTIIRDYVNNGLPMIALAKKYKCRAGLIKRTLDKYGIKVRSQKEQRDIDYRTGRLERPNIGNKHTLGYKHTREARRKLSELFKRRWADPATREKYVNYQKILWTRPQHKHKQLKAMMSGQHIKPNKPEQKVMNILKRLYPEEWKYVGDGAIIINGKNPDFINVNGYKLIIEVFGDYWHRGENPKDRAKLFMKYGYSTLVLWESELKDKKAVIRKIDEFVMVNR